MPPAIARTLEVAGMDGVYYYKSKFQERRFEIDITVTDESLEDLVEAYDRIAYFLNPKKGLQRLVFDDEPGKIYNVVVSGETNIEQIKAIGRTTVIFLVPMAFAESKGEVVQEMVSTIEPEFTRGSNAYQSNGALVSGDTPRYEIINEASSINGVWVEEGTSNLLANLDFYTIVNISATANTQANSQQYHVHTGKYGIQSVMRGVGAYEGFYTNPKTAVSSNTDYTFSAYVFGNSGTVVLRVEEYNASNVLVKTTYSNEIILTPEFERYSLKVTTTATTTQISVGIVTPTRQFVVLFADSLQLEQKSYATSFTEGQTTRVKESLIIEPNDYFSSGKILQANGYTGSIDLYFRKVGTPGALATLFDWGQYTVGNTLPRLCIFYCTSIGEDKIRFQVVNNTTNTLDNITVTLPANLVTGRTYYVMARWILTGNITTGKMDIKVVDMETMVEYTNSKFTNLGAINLEGERFARVGSNVAETDYVNAVIAEIRFSNYFRTDSDFENSPYTLRPLNKDNLSSMKYSFNNSLLPINITNIGTAPAFPIIKCSVSFSSTDLRVTIYPEGKYVQIYDTFTDGDLILIDCQRRLVTKNGSNINAVIDLLSQFPIITGDHYIKTLGTADTTVIYTPNWL